MMTVASPPLARGTFVERSSGLAGWAASPVLHVVGLTVLVLLARLCKLGAWSFWGDELVTFYDAAMLRATPYWNPTGYTNPHEQFIHACPLGFWLLSWWHQFSGESEFWCRLPLALASTGAVVLATLIVHRLRGPFVAGCLAAMLVCWPWGLFHAQNHRVYSIAYLFGALGFLAADAGFLYRSGRWIALSGVLLTFGALTHNGVCLLLLLLIGWQLGLTLWNRGQWPWWRLTALLPAIVGLAINAVLILRFTRQFAAGSWWYMSPLHCLASLVHNLGWPVALAAGAGGCWALARRRRELAWPLSVSAAIVVACLALPGIVSFRADYVFAMTLPVHLLAACAMGDVARRAWRVHRSLGVAAMLAVPATMAPSIASYFVDGDRPDHRAAAALIAPQIRVGDVVWSNQCVNVRHYLSQPRATPVPRDPVGETDAVLQRGGRVWCLLTYASAGIGPRSLGWLQEQFHLVGDVRRLRFDYHQNAVAVFLAETPRGGHAQMLPTATAESAR